MKLLETKGVLEHTQGKVILSTREEEGNSLCRIYAKVTTPMVVVIVYDGDGQVVLFYSSLYGEWYQREAARGKGREWVWERLETGGAQVQRWRRGNLWRVNTSLYSNGQLLLLVAMAVVVAVVVVVVVLESQLVQRWFSACALAAAAVVKTNVAEDQQWKVNWQLGAAAVTHAQTVQLRSSGTKHRPQRGWLTRWPRACWLCLYHRTATVSASSRREAQCRSQSYSACPTLMYGRRRTLCREDGVAAASSISAAAAAGRWSHCH